MPAAGIFGGALGPGDMLMAAYAGITRAAGTGPDPTPQSQRRSISGAVNGMSELGPSPLAAGEDNLSVAQARAAIAAQLRPIDGRERVPLLHALGRVLAADEI